MASSSNITSTPQNKYQVFLSFRGEDTRLNFTSHLYKALSEKTVVTFIDDELKRGEEISASLLSAIQESTISVIIFSRTYASSRWCLSELVEIIKCRKTSRQIVIPVFYHVDPSDVRKQSEDSAFGKAFAVLIKERFKDEVEIVQSWRSALREAGLLSGRTIDDGEPEAKSVEKIVNDILERLGTAISPSDYRNLVGVESSVKKIESLLNGDVRSIGIWGIGGVGKTTIARAVFNKISCHFDKVHFLENVGKRSKDELQKELLNAILRDECANIENSTTKHRLSLMKILIVFDDVTSLQQIVDLVRDFISFSVRNRIMITSRDKQVLQCCRVDYFYEVKTLSFDKGLDLLTQYAFKQNDIPKDYIVLSHELVSYANGLPLALKVLGCSVFGKSKEFWEAATSKLQKSPLREIDDVLKISYDGLEYEEQEIFLDIACFFKNMNRGLVTEILDACDLPASYGIDRLIDKCLITTSFDNVLMMHDLVKEMGRGIVMRERDLDRRSRLWSYKDIKDALTQNKGSEATRGIWLEMFDAEDVLRLKPFAFSKMYRLMFLKVSTGFNSKVNGFSNIESDITELRYLHWPGYQCKSLPLNFRPENLVSLEMKNSNLEQLWTGVQNLVRLKYVDLSNSMHLLKIPDLSKATNLEKLKLDECTSLIEITLPPTQNLKLVKLSLRNCKSLRRLPPGIQAKSLTLSGCTSLEVPPKMSCDMVELGLDGTGIRELSFSNEYPVNLTQLNLEKCSRLETLSFGSCNWKSLLHLNLSGCSNLKTIPKLPCLIKGLYLDGTAIEELSSSIGHLSFLQHLSLSGCSNLKMLPEFQNSEMVELHLDGTAIKKLPSSIENLSSLLILNVEDCSSLERLPEGICKLKSLYKLHLSGCSKLDRLPDDFGNLVALKSLEADGIAIKEVPSSFVRLQRLTSLSFNRCRNLELPSLSCLQSLKKLENLELADCRIIELPSFLFNLSSLEFLDLSNNNFESIPTSIINLPDLYILAINHCKRLQSLPKLPYFTSRLLAMDCTSLQTLSDFGTIADHGKSACFNFINCFNVDWDSIADKVIDDLRECLQARTEQAICFPGREIPEWFNHRGSGFSIELPPDCLNKEIEGLAFCIVLSPLQNRFRSKHKFFSLEISLQVKKEDGNYRELGCSYVSFSAEGQALICIESDHQLMGCTALRSPAVVRNLGAIFKFKITGYKDVNYQVKSAGVRLLFTDDVQEANPNSLKLQISNPFEEESSPRAPEYLCNLQRLPVAPERKVVREIVKEGVVLKDHHQNTIGWSEVEEMTCENPKGCFCFPGNEIPDWFHIQNGRDNFLEFCDMELPFGSINHNFVGLAFCTVVEFYQYISLPRDLFLHCELCPQFATHSAFGSIRLSFEGRPRCINSYQAFLGYDCFMYPHQFHHELSSDDTHLFSESSIRFAVTTCYRKNFKSEPACCIKKCGIRLLYTNDIGDPMKECCNFLISDSDEEEPHSKSFENYSEGKPSSSLLQLRLASTACDDQQPNTNSVWDLNELPEDFVERTGDVTAAPKRSLGDQSGVGPSRSSCFDDEEDEPQPKRLKELKFF